MSQTLRTHVLMPRELLDAVDRLVGQRRRSQFLVQAAEEKLQRVAEQREGSERSAAARAVIDSLADRHIPELDTPAAADEWVRAGRSRLEECREHTHSWCL